MPPLPSIKDRLDAGQSIKIGVVGDSTTYGAGDNAFPGNGTTKGWFGRMGAKLGQRYDLTTTYREYNATSHVFSGSINLNITSGFTGHTNTISMFNSGVNSQYITSLTNLIDNYGLLPFNDLDYVFIGTGINDANLGWGAGTYVPAYLDFIELIQSKCPNAVIICTTQDVLDTYAYTHTYATYPGNYDALMTELVGDVLPTSPAFQLTNRDNVYAMDTQQAYGNVYSATYMRDHVHPNAAGYDLQAEWMVNEIVGYVVPTPDAPIITTTSLLDMTRDVLFTQTLTAISELGVVWSLVDGNLPVGMSLSLAGLLAGTPAEYGSYAFTVRATVEGWPAVYTDRTYSGPIHTLPMQPTGLVKTKWHAPNGLMYEIVPRVRMPDDEFHPFLFRR